MSYAIDILKAKIKELQAERVRIQDILDNEDMEMVCEEEFLRNDIKNFIRQEKELQAAVKKLLLT